MPAPIITLANAVVSELNTPVEGSWSQTFTAARKYVVRRELKDITGWLVSVVKAGETIELATRDVDSLRDLQVDVGIQHKVDPEVLAEVDEVLDLAEEFSAYWLGRTPAAMTTVGCIEIERVSLYIPDHLDEDRVATSVQRLTFHGLF